MRLTVYRKGNVAFTLDGKEPLRQVSSAKHRASLMSDDTITVTVDAASPLRFALRDYLIYDGRPYLLNLWPEVKKTGKNMFRHTAKFEGGMFELGRVFFNMTGLNGWDYYGTLYDLCRLVVNEMNRACLRCEAGGNVLRYTGMIVNGMYQWEFAMYPNNYLYSANAIPAIGDALYTHYGAQAYTITQVGGGWTLDFESENVGGKVEPIATDEKQMTYDSHSCLAVLQDLCTTWEDWEFAVVVTESDLVTGNFPSICGGSIVLRRKQTGFGSVSDIPSYPHHLAYGKKGGLAELTRTTASEANVPSRVYFYGGSQNVPANYRNTRICLPDASKETSFLPDDGSLNADNRRCEVVKVFDDIYPANKPFSILADGDLQPGNDNLFAIRVAKDKFFNLFAKWKDPSNTTSEYGTYAEWKQSYGTGDATEDMRRYLLYFYQGDMLTMQAGFPKSCYLTSNEGVKVTFQTGDLAGYAFTIGDFDTRPANYYEIWLIRQGVETIYGDDIEKIPNESMMCHVGDQFIIDGCLMPPMYTYYQGSGDDFSAEGQLLIAALRYLDEIGDGVCFDASPNEEYVANQMKALSSFGFRVFDTLTIDDSDLAFSYSSTSFRIEEVTRDLVNGVSYKLKLGRDTASRGGASGRGASRRGAAGLKEVIRQLTRKTENVRPVIKSPTVSMGTAMGQRIYLNGVDVTDNETIEIIDATSQWFGSQAEYDDLVANNQIQPNVAYHVMPQTDWQETDPKSLGKLLNKPDFLDIAVENVPGNTAYRLRFHYRQY